MRKPFCFSLFLLTLFLASRAWGHGFVLFFPPGYDPATPPPASFNIFSNQPVLDQDQITPGPSNLFLDAFSNTPNGDGSYGTYEGSGQVNGPQPTILSATFHILSPLYFSNGTGPAVPASDGTRLHISYADSSGDPEGGTDWPLYFPSNTGIDVSGSTSLVDGFALVPTAPYSLPSGTAAPAFHELEKDLYIGDPSQADGEYGFAFDVDVTFETGSGPMTVSSGPLVDVFATDIGVGGGFATNAPDPLQDAATLAVYSAAVPEPSTIALCAMGVSVVVIGCGGLRKIRHRAP